MLNFQGNMIQPSASNCEPSPVLRVGVTALGERLMFWCMELGNQRVKKLMKFRAEVSILKQIKGDETKRGRVGGACQGVWLSSWA